MTTGATLFTGGGGAAAMTPYYSRDNITIFHGDCLEVLPELGGSKFYLLTDPPYGLGKRWTGGTWFTKNVYADDKVTWDDSINQAAVDYALSISDEAIIWGGNYYVLPPSRCWLSWDKQSIPTMADFELAWTNLDRPAKRFTHSRSGWVRQHPTEKPLPLIAWCLTKFTDGDALILDPFMGVGTTLVAARNAGRRAVGIEISETYCRLAVERLRQRTLWAAVDPAPVAPVARQARLPEGDK